MADLFSQPPLDGSNFVSYDGPDGKAQYFPLPGRDPVLDDFEQIRQGTAPWQQEPAPAPEAPAASPEPAPHPFAGMAVAARNAPAPEAPAPAPEAQPTGPAFGTEDAARQAQMQALTLAEKAALKTTEADRTEAAAEVEAVNAKRDRLKAHQDAVRDLVTERERVVGAQLKKVQTIADQARSTKINPKQLYQDAGVVRTFAGVFGVALGGLLQVTQGNNPALDILNQHIARNIDAQKANLANLQQGVENEQSILGELRTQYGDSIAAEKALHGIMLDQIGNDLEGKLAGVKDQRALARGMELLGKVRESAAEMHLGAGERTAAAAQRAFDNRIKAGELNERINARQQAGYLAGRELDLRGHEMALTAEQAKAKAKAEADGESLWFRSVKGAGGEDGSSVRIADATQRKEVGGTIGSSEEALDNVATLKAILTDEGRTELNDADKNIARSAQANILLAASQAVKGNPSDKDMKYVVDKAGGMDDPTAWWNALSVKERKKVLTYVEDTTRKNANRALKSVTGGKASFSYAGESQIRAAVKNKAPNFEKVREGVRSGAIPAATLLDTSLYAGRPEAALAMLSERTSAIKKAVRTNSSMSPKDRAKAQRELAEIGRVSAEIQARYKKQTAVPKPAPEPRSVAGLR